MHEVEQYVIQPQERHGGLLAISWIQEYLHDKDANFLASRHLWLDKYIEKWYGKQRREEHEQKPYFTYIKDILLTYMPDLLEGCIFSLRLPQNTLIARKHHNPSYWYMPEGNERQATLALGQERQSVNGEVWVDWQTTRTVSPHELIIIPPHTVHALVSPGEKTFYAALVTRTANVPKQYRLTLRDRLLISQPQNG